jgi:hypothetical protein
MMGQRYSIPDQPKREKRDKTQKSNHTDFKASITKVASNLEKALLLVMTPTTQTSHVREKVHFIIPMRNTKMRMILVAIRKGLGR